MKHLILIAAILAAPTTFAQSSQQLYEQQVRQNNLIQQQGAVMGLSNLQIQQMQQNNAYSNASQQQRSVQSYAPAPSYSAPIVLPQANAPQVDYDRVATDLARVIEAQSRMPQTEAEWLQYVLDRQK